MFAKKSGYPGKGLALAMEASVVYLVPLSSPSVVEVGSCQVLRQTSDSALT